MWQRCYNSNTTKRRNGFICQVILLTLLFHVLCPSHGCTLASLPCVMAFMTPISIKPKQPQSTNGIYMVPLQQHYQQQAYRPFFSRHRPRTVSSRLRMGTNHDKNDDDNNVVDSNYKMINYQRREELLQRKGPYFALNKKNGHVEFGATAQLTTQLNEKGGTESWHMVAEWLKDSNGLAMSIWDPTNIIPLSNQIYRLLVMKLQFIIFRYNPLLI